MKKVLLMLLVFVVFCKDVDARRRKDPFRDVNRKIESLPPLIYEKVNGKDRLTKKSERTQKQKTLLKKVKMELFSKLNTKSTKDIMRLKTSIKALTETLETKQGKSKQKYFESRLNASYKKLDEEKDELEWIHDCYDPGSSMSINYDMLGKENPFEDIDQMIKCIPNYLSGGSGKKKKTLSKSQLKKVNRRHMLVTQRSRKYRELTDELLDEIDRLQSSLEELEEIMDTDQGKRKKGYYSKRIEAVKKALTEEQNELEWVKECYDADLSNEY